jgi:hypothetical protein
LNCSLDPWVAGLEVLDHHPDGVDHLLIFELNVSLRRVRDDHGLGWETAVAVYSGSARLSPRTSAAQAVGHFGASVLTRPWRWTAEWLSSGD